VFAGWDRRVLAILERVQTLYRRGIFTRTPLSSWSAGRVALLGDSAHAMVPFHAQGAAQSIVDAAVLARCLADISAPVDALRDYADRRAAKANEVQRRSMTQGLLYHLPDGAQSQARDKAMAASAHEQPFGVLLDLWAEDAYAD
jgi:salicylate hydroxylase